MPRTLKVRGTYAQDENHLHGRNKMSKVEQAIACFESGLNCSQSVFAPYAEQFGLGREIALKIASCFGGGVGQMGQICGAVSGALMILGLKYGNTDPHDQEARKRKHACIRKFVEEFTARHHSLICRELLNCDISTPAGLQYAREQQLFAACCPPFIRSAAEILEEILE